MPENLTDAERLGIDETSLLAPNPNINIFSMKMERIDLRTVKLFMSSDILEPFMQKLAVKADGTEDLFPRVAGFDYDAYKGQVPVTLKQVFSYADRWGNFVTYPIDYCSELIKIKGINSQGIEVIWKTPNFQWINSSMINFGNNMKEAADVLYRSLIVSPTVQVRVTAATVQPIER